MFGDAFDFPDFFDIISWKVILLIIVVCVLRSWLKGQQYKGQDSIKQTVSVVTGCSGGIGKQIARELNYRGSKVYMLCRSKERGDEAVTHLIQLGCHSARLLLKIVDLNSFENVRKFVSELKKEETKVDLLVLNAAIMLFPKYQLTKDGHELTWQTNYLSHFLLTELLMPLLEAAPQGRIVHVSAVAHRYVSSLDLGAVDRRDAFEPREAYARSKAAQVMHARELTRRLREKGSAVTINACHPGISYTRLARHTPMATNPVLKWTLAPLAWFFLKTPKDGAQTPLFLALDKSLNGVSGKYFAELIEAEVGELVENDEMCQELYTYSLQACESDKDSNSKE